MTGDLSIVRAKLDRAREHQREFQSVIDAYANGPGNFEAVQEHRDNGWNELVLRIHREPPSIQLALIHGDTMSNARAALDYLVWQLVLQAGNEPKPNNYFPVVVDEQKWDGAVGGQLSGVALSCIETIREMQPFHESRPSYHFLACLHEANNFSKHRTVPTTVQAVHAIELQNVPVTPGMRYRTELNEEFLVDGSVMLRLRREDGAIAPLLNVGSVVWRVAFDFGTDQRWDTTWVLDHIEKIIDRFEPAFA